jgi:hypothetical protein
MRIRAEFSDGMKRQLDGRAIGDEFTVTATARIIGAEEALIDIRSHADEDVHVIQGELEVTLLISNAKVMP